MFWALGRMNGLPCRASLASPASLNDWSWAETAKASRLMTIQPMTAIPSQKAIRRAGGLRRPGRAPGYSRRVQGLVSGGRWGPSRRPRPLLVRHG
jgi:hypothetical protein